MAQRTLDDGRQGMKLGCIVLAAGHSRRFGDADKLLCDLGGKPLAKWILDSIPREAFSDMCAVITNDGMQKVCEKSCFPCARYEGGELSDSVRTGLRALPPDLDGYMFVNADRPFLKSDTIRMIVGCFAENPNSAVRLYWRGMPSNPILFPGSAREELADLCGDRGGSAVLKHGKYAIQRVEASSEAETWDADSVEMLEKMREYIK